MLKNFTIIILLFSFLISYSQEPSIAWQNSVGGTMSDRVRSIYPTNDGGCIVGGISQSSISGDKSENLIGVEDFWVVKLNAIGNVEWENTIGGTAQDQLEAIKQTPDNGYIISGRSISSASSDKSENPIGNYDYWIVKLNSSGTIQWENTIGGFSLDEASEVLALDDGTYIVGGSSVSSIGGDKTENGIGSFDYWVLKLDNSGNIIWQNTIGGASSDALTSIDETTDGGFILGGNSQSGISGDKTESSYGQNDYWIVKIDGLGQVQWDKTYGGSESDWCVSVKQTNEGGYILSGGSYSSISGNKTENTNGSIDYWIIKTDSNGVIEWQNTIGGSEQDHDVYTIQTPDDQFLSIGGSNSNISGDKDENSEGSFDLWLVKSNTDGSINWQETIGGINPETMFKVDFHESSSSLFIANSSFSGISGDKTEANIGSFDFWVMKLDDVTLSNEEFNSIYKLSLYPNPTSKDLNIFSEQQSIDKILIYSLKGSLIDRFLNLRTNNFTIDTSNYSQGIYFAEIISGNSTTTKKFIKK